MAARKRKSGNLSLRLDPITHSRLADTAKHLGIGINALLNITIRSGLPWFEALAIHVHDPKLSTLLLRWSDLNGISEVTEFYSDFRILKRGQTCLFDDGNWYQLRETAETYELIQVEAPGFLPVSKALRERSGLQPPTPQEETP